MMEVPESIRGLQALDRQSREMVRDLQVRRPGIYWADFLVTSLIGWSWFAVAVYFPWGSPPMMFAVVAAAFAFYRDLLFVHEISHFTGDGMRGFETAWNLLAGFPLLLPSFAYCGMHQDHHRIHLYGTERDPEYLPFARSPAMTACFALESFLLPALFTARFLLAAPPGLVFPRLHRWLAVHASSLVINFRYRREVSRKLEMKMRRSELAVLLVWGGAIAAAWRGVLPWHMFGVWFVMVSLASFVNTLRTLAAHDYESNGEAMDRMSQLRDSIDHPGGWWTELWAPLGLRYHALHHYFPGLPYHNLGKAYGRLVTLLPASSQYHSSTSRSLAYSLCELYRKGTRRNAGPPPSATGPWLRGPV
jgi:fatty acid desaturase